MAMKKFFLYGLQFGNSQINALTRWEKFGWALIQHQRIKTYKAFTQSDKLHLDITK